MSVTPQKIGHGGSFSFGVPGSPETFTAVDGFIDCDFGSNKVDAHDTTDATTSGIDRVYIGGLRNPGDATLKFNVVPGSTSQAAFHALQDATVHDFKYVSQGTIMSRAFSGLITGWDISFPNEKPPMITAKIQISGAITDTNL